MMVRPTRIATFNPLFGDLEPFSDRLTRERLVSLDGGYPCHVKIGTLVA